MDVTRHVCYGLDWTGRKIKMGDLGSTQNPTKKPRQLSLNAAFWVKLSRQVALTAGLKNRA